MNELPESRTEAVNRVARYLRSKSKPRLLLFVILVFTGIAGAASSFLMLHAGLGAMYVRYPIAALMAYLVFLLLLRLWQARQTMESSLSAQLEKPAAEPPAAKPRVAQERDRPPRAARSYLDSLDALDFLSVFDETALLPWLLIAAVAGALALLALVLSFAPILLAEVLLDGLLVAGIWKRFKKPEDGHPLAAAFRITRIPALLVIVGLFVVGYLLQLACPRARSMGDVFRSL